MTTAATVLTSIRVREAEQTFNATSLLPSVCYLLLVLHFCYGVAPILGDGAKRVLFLTASLLFFPVLLATFWICAARRTPWPGFLVSGRGLQLLCAGFAVAVMGSALFFSFPNTIAAPAIGAFALLIAVVWWRGGVVQVVYATLAVAVALLTVRALGLASPAADADMLPVIRWADLEFLAGRNPYFEDYSSVTLGPFYYLPVQWLVYLPLVALGLDPSLLNLASMFGCVAALALALRGSPHRIAGLAVLAGLCASRPAVEMISQGQVWPIWLLLSLYAFAFTAGRDMLAAVLLGVLLAAHQSFILLVALVGLHGLRNVGLRRAVVLGLVSVAVYAALIVPFARGVADFIVTNYVTLPHLAGTYSARLSNSVLQMSMVNILTVLGLADLRQGLQVMCGLVGLAVVAGYRRMPRSQLLALFGLVYMLAIALNVQVWKYYYLLGIFPILWSLPNSSICASRTPASRRDI